MLAVVGLLVMITLRLDGYGIPLIVVLLPIWVPLLCFLACCVIGPYDSVDDICVKLWCAAVCCVILLATLRDFDVMPISWFVIAVLVILGIAAIVTVYATARCAFWCPDGSRYLDRMVGLLQTMERRARHNASWERYLAERKRVRRARGRCSPPETPQPAARLNDC